MTPNLGFLAAGDGGVSLSKALMLTASHDACFFSSACNKSRRAGLLLRYGWVTAAIQRHGHGSNGPAEEVHDSLNIWGMYVAIYIII
jgi:hypothetical protein